MTSDTAPIRSEERFDEQSVADYLRRAVPDLVGDADIMFDQFPGGAANLTYRAVAGATELVLRRAPLGPVAPGAHDMAREYRVLSRLWRGFPLAPRAFHYCDDSSVMGKPFLVMERRKGHVIRSTWPEPFGDDAAPRRRVAEGLVDTLALLHSVDPAEVGLDDLGRPDGFVRRQVEGWTRRWEAAATRHVPEMEEVAGGLLAAIPQPQATVILHNDFKLDNVMVSGSGAMVAVFDWDMATRGDPLVDLGTLLAYWADPDDATYLVFAERAVTLTPYMDRAEAAARYADATGLNLEELAFYVALAYFRIAVIIEQIYTRYASGQTHDSRFARFEPLAPMLARAALSALEGTT